MSQKNVCIYHHNCALGFAGAWIIRRKIGNTLQLTDPRPVFMTDKEFSKLPATKKVATLTGATVYLVDTCFSVPALKYAIDIASKVYVIDDKPGSLEIVSSCPKSDKLSGSINTDKNVSVVDVCWRYAFPVEPMPMFLQYLVDMEDTLPDSKAWVAYMMSFPLTFENFDSFTRIIPHDSVAKIEALAIKRFIDQQERKMDSEQKSIKEPGGA